MATSGRFPASRIDALTDGVFGVAMTLLVFNIKLPEPLPQTAAALLESLRREAGSFASFALAFFLLGQRWAMSLRPADEPEATAGGREVAATLLHLFFVSCAPFTVGTVRSLPGLWPAISLFALNMALLAASGLWLLHQGDLSHPVRQRRRLGLNVLLACSIIAMLLAPSLGRQALWAFLLMVAWAVWKRIFTKIDRR